MRKGRAKTVPGSVDALKKKSQGTHHKETKLVPRITRCNSGGEMANVRQLVFMETKKE